ncbi:inactive tyrosine-protein kinase PRAG1 [Rhinophrynus dorsalis]
MHKDITLNSQGLKMSVCSEFVEHIWKPGSCKNCFHPRSDHRKPQALSDGKTSNLPVSHNLNGIRIKSENTHQDDDIVIAALYSKPTIAVKPTMITPDNEVWTELNNTETLTQVSWKVSQTSNSVLKSGDISRVILDNISKPFSHNYNSCNDNTPKYVFTGLKSPDRKMGINSVHNLTYVSHFGGQADKATFLKEKVPTSHEESSQGTILNGNGDTKRINIIQEESTLLSLKSSSGCSSGTLSSIERTTPTGTLVSRDIGKPSTGLHSLDIPTQTKLAKDENDKKCLKNLDMGSSKNLHFSKLKVSLHSESDTLSDTLSCNSIKDSPLASPTDGFHSPNDYRRNLAKHSQRFTHTEQHLQLQVEGSHSEPIYAESTKRKGVPGRVGISTKAERHIEKNSITHEVREEKLHSLNNDKMYQESTAQVAAKITVMAAHTEEDNRTIFLSSPDSAVGVQWTCGSPSSAIENASLSPTFVWDDRRQEIKAVEVNKSYSTQVSHKIQSATSPGVPPKITKPEECSNAKLNSPTHSHGILCSASHKKESIEVNDRCLPSGERRQRFYQAQWSRQCRIDEEEEEETSISQQSKKSTVTNGQLVKSSISSYNHDERTKLEEQKSWKGMNKSSSCPVELSKSNNDTEDSSQPPPPPPKKQPRQPHKMKSSCELEKLSLGSVESLGESFKATNNSNVNINVSFSTSSIDSLDSRTCSEGGLSYEAVNSPTLSPGGEKKHFTQISFSVDASEESKPGSIQPPPLPVKKSMNRASSVPDNSALGRSSPARTGVLSNSPRLNLSQSESNVCGEEATQPGFPLSPGERHVMFSSSESLEKCCRGSGHRSEVRNRNCLQSRGTSQALSSSQLSVSSHNSSGSSLQLHHLLSNIDSKEGMYAKLSGLYAQSMRRLVNKCEDHFMRDQRKELRFNENNWSLFKLTSNKPCCNAGDAIYYSVTCAKDPHNNYAVKMCRTEDTKTPYCSLSLPVHFNIQQDCGHFLATVPSSLLHPSESSKGPSANDSSQSVGPSIEQECVVVITREVPYRTTADFVRESATNHQLQPEVYERQVCLLLLQLCNGLEHLKEHGIIHRDLCLENLLLVHCQTSQDKVQDGKHVPRLIVSNFSKAKQRPGCEESKPRRDKTRLAPEIMAASQYKKFDEFQAGILIYELLHQPNPFEVRTSLHEHEYSQKDLPPLPPLSVYSRGLQHLAHLLLEADPIKRIRISEAKRILQCLLWGPRKDLTDQPFSHEEALHCALQNWIDMKRALLMMKFAEKSLDPAHNISLEDWLCCQYLATADPCYLYKTLKLIKLI